jgi:hypothetical protein
MTSLSEYRLADLWVLGVLLRLPFNLLSVLAPLLFTNAFALLIPSPKCGTAKVE